MVWIPLIVMAGIAAALLIKIYFLKKAASEIAEGFADRLMNDTNTTIDISSRDRSMRRLAEAVNVQLRRLRAQRHRFCQGDIELKCAVTNISHDLRTPLTAICGYLELLRQEEKTETAERYIKVIENRTDMLIQLTEELFGYSVILSGEKSEAKEAVVINAVLEESIAAFYTALHERGIKPVIRMPEEKVIRILERSCLSRVFSNLLNNVIKYSDGDLTITLSKTGEIVFSNTARGLDKIQVEKLFDRFYTVEDARKSTGLGLSICRALMEQMNGTISAGYENGRLDIRIFLS